MSAAARLRHVTLEDLPPGFSRAPVAGERVGLKPRMVRIHAASEEGIALLVDRPCPLGGAEYAVCDLALSALPRGDNPTDTGDLCDGRRYVTSVERAFTEGDTGVIEYP